MKKLFLLILIFMLCCFLSSCYDRAEIDDQAFVIAFGLDKGKTNFLRMTFQIAVPSAFGQEGGGSSGESGEGKEKHPKSVTITTIESPTVYSGFNIVNTYVSKQLNLSHTKVLIISSELAKENMGMYINAIHRGREFRNTMYICVCDGSAEEYLKNVNFVLDISPSKFYEETFASHRYTSFTANTQLIQFISRAKSKSINPVAILVGVDRIEKLDDYSKENTNYKEKGRENYFGGDFAAGNIPKEYKNKTSAMGLAVFDGAKMVGMMDGAETRYYLMLTGEYDYSYVTVPDPVVENKFVLLNVKQSRKPRHNVVMEGDTPKISVKIMLEADILSIQSGINYEDPEKVEELETASEEFFKKDIVRLLEKTTKVFKSDIFGFGKSMKWKFLTQKEWDEFSWHDKYPNAQFDIEVDLKIRRPGLILRTAQFEN